MRIHQFLLLPMTLALITIGSPISAASSKATTDLSGTYVCSGADSEGKQEYSNQTTFAKSGSTYNIQWLDSKGYPNSFGTGFFNGTLDNAFAVVFWDISKPDSYGTLLYTVKPDGTLEGKWAIHKSTTLGTETCKKVKK